MRPSPAVTNRYPNALELAFAGDLLHPDTRLSYTLTGTGRGLLDVHLHPRHTPGQTTPPPAHDATAAAVLAAATKPGHRLCACAAWTGSTLLRRLPADAAAWLTATHLAPRPDRWEGPWVIGEMRAWLALTPTPWPTGRPQPAAVATLAAATRRHVAADLADLVATDDHLFDLAAALRDGHRFWAGGSRVLRRDPMARILADLTPPPAPAADLLTDWASWQHTIATLGALEVWVRVEDPVPDNNIWWYATDWDASPNGPAYVRIPAAALPMLPWESGRPLLADAGYPAAAVRAADTLDGHANPPDPARLAALLAAYTAAES